MARGEIAECFTSNWQFIKEKQGTGRTVTFGNSWKGSWQQVTVPADRKSAECLSVGRLDYT